MFCSKFKNEFQRLKYEMLWVETKKILTYIETLHILCQKHVNQIFTEVFLSESSPNFILVAKIIVQDCFR